MSRNLFVCTETTLLETAEYKFKQNKLFATDKNVLYNFISQNLLQRLRKPETTQTMKTSGGTETIDYNISESNQSNTGKNPA